MFLLNKPLLNSNVAECFYIEGYVLDFHTFDLVIVHDCGADNCHLINLEVSGNDNEYPNCSIQIFMESLSIATIQSFLEKGCICRINTKLVISMLFQ